MNKKFLFCGLVCLSLFAFMGCGTKKLDISNCIDIRYGEFNGKAKIYENSIDVEKLTQIPKLQKLTSDMLKDDYKIKLVGDKTDLKNGDKVKLSLDYNKELYKRDFDVEFTFEPKEITIEGLPDELTDIKQISKDQWENLYKVASKQAEDIANNSDYSDLMLEKLLVFEKLPTEKLTLEFIYSYKDFKNKKHYFNLSNMLSLKSNSELEFYKFNSSDIWKNPLILNSNKSLNELLKEVHSTSNYEVIWSADNQ
ncbi:TcpJ [Clostridium perfringens]|nr:TcpJ [Clostridium perfringens]